MGMYRTWEFSGRNNDGSYLTSRQIECLVALDEYDLENLTFEEGDLLFGWGNTESIGAYEGIMDALEKFAAIYPEVRLFVTDQEGSEYAIFVKGGKVREATGRVVYTFDDDGEEVDLDDY